MEPMLRLAEHEWRPLVAAHEARIDALTVGHLARRDRKERHPVIDFLFDYYGHTPGKLRRWSPGAGVILERAADDPCATRTHMAVDRDTGDVQVDVGAFLAARGSGVAFIGKILERTLARPIQTGCFGLHEWAMVYRQPDDRRHPSWPLRLGAEGTNAVVERSTLACSHFDATRFFTEEALPRNTLAPTRDTMLDLEQPGCLHAGMDLYRWAFKLAPAMPSDLIADAFELALDIRTLDMQASPYDFRALGYEPVAIETPEGRQAYAQRQRAFGERGNALRQRLLDAVDRVRPRLNVD